MGIYTQPQRTSNKKNVECIINKGQNSILTNPDNIYIALGDWLVLGEQADFRRKE